MDENELHGTGISSIKLQRSSTTCPFISVFDFIKKTTKRNLKMLDVSLIGGRFVGKQIFMGSWEIYRFKDA